MKREIWVEISCLIVLSVFFRSCKQESFLDLSLSINFNSTINKSTSVPTDLLATSAAVAASPLSDSSRSPSAFDSFSDRFF